MSEQSKQGQDHSMKRGLKNRHMQMTALGASVGTGLFYGSDDQIGRTGYYCIVCIGRPLYFLCYAHARRNGGT